MSWRCGLLLLLALVALIAPPRAAAQTDKPPRLSDQEPFDRITLNEENQGAVIKVEPLDLPGRRLPQNPNPEDRLRVKLYAQPDKTYEIAWQHIVKVELFEELLLAEVRQFIAADQLDDAYDALQFLKQSFPDAPGLDAQIEAYLYLSAGRLFRQQRWPEALAVLEELHRVNPEFKSAEGRPLAQVLAAVLEKILAGYVSAADYRAARIFLARVERDYGASNAATVSRWKQQLAALAMAQRDAARQFIAGGKLRDANRAVRKMNEIWPQVEGGAALVTELSARYPMIAVGVTQLAKSTDFRRVDDWAARRAGRLTTRQLVEFLRPGPEGGQYAFPYGSLQISEDRRRLTLQLSAENLPEGSTATGYDLARRLLSAADKQNSDYSATWANLFGGVTVRDVMSVDIDLRHPYVIPASTLQLPWNPAATTTVANGATGMFRPAPLDGLDQPFVCIDRPASAQAPAEITERLFEDPAEMLAALRRGDIDVIDRVFPADVAKLSHDSTLTVGRYALPSLHFLIPSPESALAQNSTIRRAISYAIPREEILHDQLLGGSDLEGCRLISGPFSPGMSDNDPLAYAGDPDIRPRPYDPRLAATLISVVVRQRKDEAEKQMQTPKPLTLVIGHPQSEVARVASQSIAERLTALGIATTLQALPPGETRDLNNECDFVYAEATLGEPMVDARRLLAADGAARAADPYINLALRRLDEATNWTEARTRLRDVHRIVHADMTVIPLWQLVEHYACRRELTGLDENVVSLYENVSGWRRDTTAATARAARP